MNSPSSSRAPDLPITSSDALTTEIHRPNRRQRKFCHQQEDLRLIGEGIDRGDKIQKWIFDITNLALFGYLI